MALPEWTLWAAVLATPIAVTVLLQGRVRDMPWIMLASVAGFLGGQAGTALLGPALGACLGALSVGLAAHAYERWLGRPALVALVPGVLLLVPGSTGFRSLALLVDQQVVIGIDAAFATLLTAASLVAGLLMAEMIADARRAAGAARALAGLLRRPGGRVLESGASASFPSNGAFRLTHDGSPHARSRGSGAARRREPVAARPGTTVNGRYLIERELGRGGIGVVYLARDLRLHDMPVVIKFLLDDSTQNAWLSRKFLQEAEALTRIHHPGVVRVIDRDRTADGRPFFVMEFVKGASLRSAIRPTGLDLEFAAAIVRDVGQALSAAHLEGVLHRDLKPENIMLETLSNGAQHAKLIDFGIAKVRDSQDGRAPSSGHWPARSSTWRRSSSSAHPRRSPATSMRSPSSPTSC